MRVLFLLAAPRYWLSRGKFCHFHSCSKATTQRVHSSSRAAAAAATDGAAAAQGDTPLCGSFSAEHPQDGTAILTRTSHRALIDQGRDWDSVGRFWRELVAGDLLPPPWLTNASFDLSATSPALCTTIPSGEKNQRRKTWFVTLAYFGPNFVGWDWNKDGRSVTGDVQKGLRKIIPKMRVEVAGRTDAGVSAYGQVLSLFTPPNVDKNAIHEAITSVTKGDIRVLQVEQVPRRLHSTFSAKWRRYVYLFPLNEGPHDGHEICVKRANAMLQSIQGGKERGGEEEGGGEGHRWGSFMYGKIKTAHKEDVCRLMEARARVRTLRLSSGEEVPVMAVELVGDRFLRRQVRILVSTLVRECMLAAHHETTERDGLSKVPHVLNEGLKKAPLEVPVPPMRLDSDGKRTVPSPYMPGSETALLDLLGVPRDWIAAPAPSLGLGMMGAGYSEWGSELSPWGREDEGGG